MIPYLCLGFGVYASMVHIFHFTRLFLLFLFDSIGGSVMILFLLWFGCCLCSLFLDFPGLYPTRALICLRAPISFGIRGVGHDGSCREEP